MLNSVFQRDGRANGNAPVNLAEMSFLRYLAEDDADQQAHYIQLRKWHDGDHEVPLTDRQREYLAVDAQFQFSINYLPLPVDLVTERLTVNGFDGPEGIGGDDGILAEWWEANRMDALQSQVHRAAARDGDTYIIIEPPTEGRPYPAIFHEPAYDGDEGVKVHYVSNMRREMTFASKRWSERRLTGEDKFETIRRLNLYRPESIERYYESGRGWQPYDEPGKPWRTPWPAGEIPVVHFRWQDSGGNWGKSELENIIPVQEMINKAVLDDAEAADKTGSALITLTGAKWPDGVTVKAGDVLSVSAADASFGAIPPGDLSQLRARINDYIVRMAQLSHIPLQYFQLTGAIASADTQAADDSQLVAKVQSQAVAIGNAWEDVMRIALRLNAEYGDGRDIAPTEKLVTQWKDFDRVDPLATEQRRADILDTLIRAGVSLPGALARVGYPEDAIELMLRGDTVDGIQQ